MKKITKLVIPVAGMGTRFLPATKAMPKEMLPIVDKPIIQYIVEEAVASGIKDIILVTGWHKRSIEDHFDYPYELEKRLLESGKEKQAAEVREIANLANFIYIRQKGPYGNGTPVLNARQVVGEEPFAVMWGDEFIYSNPPRLKQLISAYEKYGKPCISAVRVPEIQTSKYGIADVSLVHDNVYKINRIVEKPKAGEAPSNLAAHGAYVLPPDIFDILEKTPLGQGNELWLVDAITALAKIEDIYAVEIQNGKYYDTGNKLEYLKTVVEFALKHPEVSREFREYLLEISKTL
ncbi:MAG: UTP--glucose-1-phosphate uridylyltransferase [Candidatus Ryanbacteria bacterium RIFCSPLOWO2_01_FULL_48_26]|uniref:UTP--glucose-1-phosphate uridylyltransferase n=1 Tax=Candidatus Ryanbacteria bacterium RIFCSPLOWO2_01_FULL_48_26 TaxID=1802126 RepID=A0A1G2GRF5_9BACT|nr:MAG: UTP--glucose-1-phosphate uridylyltransferase [Candidatus Ryanbacteria bacterium RIFCSPLOWO2_01_FULL_48_26]